MNVIHFDMDGVLADAEGEFFRITGTVYDHTNPWSDEVRREFYTKHSRFFRDLPWIPGSRLLFDYAATIAPVGICSSVSKQLPDSCGDQKLAWLDHHGLRPRCVADRVIITPPRANKGLYARPGDILIDDYKVNIQRWIAAGGVGIHFQSALQAFDALHVHLKAGPQADEYRRRIEEELRKPSV